MAQHPQHKQLPEPTDEAKDFSAQLQKKILSKLKQHQEMSFSRFMEMALYQPKYGYYSSGLTKFGRGGDFVTAPEISPIFSRCLARQAIQILKTLETPNILEFGAGQGTMAKDILLELIEREQPLERYYILEISADLRDRQKQTIEAHIPPKWAEKVVWLNALPSTPIQAAILANEVLDAMPFERLRIEPEQSLIGYVRASNNHGFEWDYRPITDLNLQRFANQLIEHIGKVSHLGYETEINLNIAPWIKSLSQILSKGAVILIDYGYAREEYYQPARVMGTLRCHYQHRAHQNPFFYPGLQDITAHVDFTAVAEAAFDHGFKVAGYTTQAHFLMASGVMEMAVDTNASIEQQIKTSQQIKTLTLPDEMGETFKVIALTKQINESLMGFQVRDLRHTL
jgi:SAM-dependent MidA family methyltransferase